MKLNLFSLWMRQHIQHVADFLRVEWMETSVRGESCVMYGFAYRHKAELRVGGMRMLRFSPGVTRGDRSRNGQNRGTLRVQRDGDKME